MKSHCKSNITAKDKHKREEHGAKIRRLSEAIILQTIEDLWIKKERERCINFFSGEEFNICAGMAGMNFHDKAKVLNLCWNILRQNSETEVGISDTLEKKTGSEPHRRISREGGNPGHGTGFRIKSGAEEKTCFS